MSFQSQIDRQLRRRIAKDLKRTDRVSAAAHTDLPFGCNCCVQYRAWGTYWRGAKICVARFGRYWAMGRNIPEAARLVLEMKEKAAW